MRIFISGQGGFAVLVAEKLIQEGYLVIGISSPEFRSSSYNSWDRLRSWAYGNDIPWVESTNLKGYHVPAETDIVLAAHSHAFIGRGVRSRAKVASLGYHPSLLPLHRGRDAVRWTIRDKERVTGGSVYHLSDRVDAGPIAAQEHILVPSNSTPQSLWHDHLAPLGLTLIARVFNDLASGRRIEVAQDEHLATWEPAMGRPPLYRPELPELTSGKDLSEGHYTALHVN